MKLMNEARKIKQQENSNKDHNREKSIVSIQVGGVQNKERDLICFSESLLGHEKPLQKLLALKF